VSAPVWLQSPEHEEGIMVTTGITSGGGCAPASRWGQAGALAAAVALALGALAPDIARAQADRWSGGDKALHVGVSAPFGVLGATLAGRDGTTGERLLVGTLVGSLPGLAKEVADARRVGHDPSAKDMAANLIGAALGALLADCCLIRPLSRGDRVDGVGIEYRVDF